MDFENTLQFCICKTGGEGAMHVICKKNYDLRHYQCMNLVLLCKTRAAGSLFVHLYSNFQPAALPKHLCFFFFCEWPLIFKFHFF